MREMRRQCRVIITLAAVHLSFSLDVEIGDLEVLKTPIAKAGLKPVQEYGNSTLRNIA